MHILEQQRIDEVLRKVDGQMVAGVVIGEEVQCWSRKGLTGVGVAATRLMRNTNCCAALIKDMDVAGCTSLFEMIGEQSRIKTLEQRQPELILIAVRHKRTGQYHRHEDLLTVTVGQHYGVTVVARLQQLEGMSMRDLAGTVQSWRGREGVVVRMEGGHMVKIKSNWWFQTGYCSRFRQEAKLWKQKEVKRQQSMQKRMRSRAQRLAVVSLTSLEKPTDLFRIFAAAKKIEVVRNLLGKITSTMVSFETHEARLEAEQIAKEKGWKAVKAYSNRTQGKLNRRIEVFSKDG